MPAPDGAGPYGPVCPRCTGRGDAHYLTCPTLQLVTSPGVGPGSADDHGQGSAALSARGPVNMSIYQTGDS